MNYDVTDMTYHLAKACVDVLNIQKKICRPNQHFVINLVSCLNTLRAIKFSSANNTYARSLSEETARALHMTKLSKYFAVFYTTVVVPRIFTVCMW